MAGHNKTNRSKIGQFDVVQNKERLPYLTSPISYLGEHGRYCVATLSPHSVIKSAELQIRSLQIFSLSDTFFITFEKVTAYH